MNYLCAMMYSSNLLCSIKKEALSKLQRLYPLPEAENMLNRVIEHLFGLSRVGQQLNRERRLSESEILLFQKSFKRLLAHEPLQYILGETEFYGLHLEVGPGVLIPRPETEELVDKIIKENVEKERTVLDVGTGSGCIALALKNVRPDWDIWGVDNSEQALKIAEKNIRNTGLEVGLVRCNILEPHECHAVLHRNFQLIVSNPPYVLKKEKSQMAANVLQYEPPEALFVADREPLLFYRRIVEFSAMALEKGGALYFEVNENYAEQTARLFDNALFYSPEIESDLFGKQRFVKAVRRL